MKEMAITLAKIEELKPGRPHGYKGKIRALLSRLAVIEDPARGLRRSGNERVGRIARPPISAPF